MFNKLLIAIFGQSYETSIASIFVVIGLIPQAIQYLDLEVMPEWLKVIGLVCSFISFIYLGIKTKSTSVTGTGEGAERPKDDK